MKSPGSYKFSLGQYPTTPGIAARLCYMGYADGNISGKIVGDFGTGNGILSVGASLLGADEVFAYDADPDMVRLAHENTEGMAIEVILSEIDKVKGRFDTVLMNPPWGDSSSNLDRAFMLKASETSGHLYAIHNIKSLDFLENFYNRLGKVEQIVKVTFDMPRIYRHHTRDLGRIEGAIFSVSFNG
ncbi:MAG: METTL5 family protein [Candidatus Thermoplasmatota archaeon]|nr:METTL5 family protein [Candidatus Thermoplasmatota archaeon]